LSIGELTEKLRQFLGGRQAIDGLYAGKARKGARRSLPLREQACDPKTCAASRNSGYRSGGGLDAALLRGEAAPRVTAGLSVLERALLGRDRRRELATELTRESTPW
jgi:hypothetical protein